MMRIEDKKLLNVDLTAVAGENCSPPTVPMTMKKRSRDLHILEVRKKVEQLDLGSCLAI